MDKQNAKLFSPDWWKQFGWLNLGTVILAVGVYFFKFPNHFTTGGVSGISILVAHYVPAVTTATLNLILNVVLLIIGAAFLVVELLRLVIIPYVLVPLNGLIGG